MAGAMVATNLAVAGDMKLIDVTVPLDALVEARYRRFRNLGPYLEIETPQLPTPERPGLADRLRNLLDPGRWSGVPNIPAGRHDELPARDEV